MTNPGISNNDLWNLIKSYFGKTHLEKLVRHQLESYNNFIDTQLLKTIEMFNQSIEQENL